jgi:hypothetical protein
MDEYLAKPIEPGELAAALNRWLGVESPASTALMEH